MSYYSLFIFSLYLLTCLIAYFNKFVNNKFFLDFLSFTVAFVAFLFAAFRPYYFPDVDSYEVIFEFSKNVDIFSPVFFASHGEPGFKLLNFWFARLGFSYDDFLLFISLFSLFLLVLISYLSKINFSYIWFVYFSFFFIVKDFGVIRVALASHFIILFLLTNVRYIKFFILLITVLFFQYASIIILFLYYFQHRKINFYYVVLFLFIFFLFFYNLNFSDFELFIPEHIFVNYSNSKSIQPGGILVLIPFLRNTIIFIVCYLCFQKFKSYEHRSKFLWCLLLSLFLYLPSFTSIVLGQRLSAYFFCVITIVISYLIKHENKSNFNILFSICIFSFLTYFYFNSWIYS